MSSEMRGLVRKWKFNLRLLGPDVARRVLESCIADVDALLARTEAGADGAEVLRLRHLLAATEEQVRVLTGMVERGQAHHERMMKLMGPQDASGDAVTEADIVALVAGPYKYHHKMDEQAEREAKAFDRCRELTIQKVQTFFAMRAAMQAKEAK